MRQSIGFVVVAAVLALGACGGEEGEGGVTAEESRQLNETAEMLDTSPDSLVAEDETGLAAEGNLEGAESGDLMVADTPATNAQE